MGEEQLLVTTALPIFEDEEEVVVERAVVRAARAKVVMRRIL